MPLFDAELHELQNLGEFCSEILRLTDSDASVNVLTALLASAEPRTYLAAGDITLAYIQEKTHGRYTDEQIVQAVNDLTNRGVIAAIGVEESHEWAVTIPIDEWQHLDTARKAMK